MDSDGWKDKEKEIAKIQINSLKGLLLEMNRRYDSALQHYNKVLSQC